MSVSYVFQVLVETCEPQSYEYCEKLTNTVAFPVEEQNCRFVPKSVCEVLEMTRPKKVKRYSYVKDCNQLTGKYVVK